MSDKPQQKLDSNTMISHLQSKCSTFTNTFYVVPRNYSHPQTPSCVFLPIIRFQWNVAQWFLSGVFANVSKSCFILAYFRSYYLLYLRFIRMKNNQYLLSMTNSDVFFIWNYYKCKQQPKPIMVQNEQKRDSSKMRGIRYSDAQLLEPAVTLTTYTAKTAILKLVNSVLE